MPDSGEYAELFGRARATLLGNVVELASGPYLSAGGGQFRGLWTRDFCFAAPGLLELGRGDVVAHHLSGLLARQRASDGLVPRLMDSMSPAYLRVFWHCSGRWVPALARELPLTDALVAEYRSEHGVEAVDSNLLVLAAALAYVEKTGDGGWWARHEQPLLRAYRYYDALLDAELVVQPPFSDWQDSARRAGKTFYTNLLYADVTARLSRHAAFGIPPERARAIVARLHRAFFDAPSGLYRSVQGSPHLSLDGVLLALDRELVRGEAAAALYSALRRHALWTRHDAPGWCTTPDYPSRWISVQTKLVGLRHYHDRLRWSWLTALAAKVAARCGDLPEAQRLLALLQSLVARDGAIYEVYAPEPPYAPWRSRWYHSERDFSWGAGLIVEAVAAVHVHAESNAAANA